MFGLQGFFNNRPPKNMNSNLITIVPQAMPGEEDTTNELDSKRLNVSDSKCKFSRMSLSYKVNYSHVSLS